MRPRASISLLLLLRSLSRPDIFSVDLPQSCDIMEVAGRVHTFMTELVNVSEQSRRLGLARDRMAMR